MRRLHSIGPKTIGSQLQKYNNKKRKKIHYSSMLLLLFRAAFGSEANKSNNNNVTTGAKIAPFGKKRSKGNGQQQQQQQHTHTKNAKERKTQRNKNKHTHTQRRATTTNMRRVQQQANEREREGERAVVERQRETETVSERAHWAFWTAQPAAQSASFAFRFAAFCASLCHPLRPPPVAHHAPLTTMIALAFGHVSSQSQSQSHLPPQLQSLHFSHCVVPPETGHFSADFLW